MKWRQSDTPAMEMERVKKKLFVARTTEEETATTAMNETELDEIADDQGKKRRTWTVFI